MLNISFYLSRVKYSIDIFVRPLFIFNTET